MSITGQPIDRVDGRSKVTGAARYSAEYPLPHLAHAVLITSTIAHGRIARIDADTAMRMPGVLAVMTHYNAPKLPGGGKAAAGTPPAGRVLTLLQDDRVYYNNQPIAVVVADTLEHARHAAQLVHVAYQPEPAILDFEQAKQSAYAPPKLQKGPTDTQRGDVESGLKAADAHIDAVYSTPMEHHNPMEPHATTAVWDGDHLTLYDATQYVTGDRRTVAKALGIAPENVRVVCPYVGGGFGGKGSTWSHVVLAAMAARQTGKPVKLVLERLQMFGSVGGRPRTEQRLVIAAKSDGRLTALQHQVTTTTSFLEEWVETSAMVTRMLYDVPNQQTTHRVAKLHVGTPTFMRAPGESTGTYALEVAMDELAYQLHIDPLQLRLQNYAEKDPESGKPWSSKSLRECYRAGAERFGWARRDPRPRSMKDADALIGWGMATATYPANRQGAAASARLLPDGTALVRSGSQDLGTGTYTVMTQVAADALGLPPEKVKFELGDTLLPEAPVSGGSQSVASVAPAVQAAAAAVRVKLIDLARTDAASPVHGADSNDIDIENGWLYLRSNTARRDPIAAVLARNGGHPIEADARAAPGDEKNRYSMHSFGSVFAEVRVDPDLGVIRVPRIVGAYGVGRLLNRKTAHSQLMGGIVWGLSMALFENTEYDPRTGRPVNSNLAEYHIPVNADVGNIDVIVVDENDPYINPLGAKGIGEIGITGVAAALANAVFHATGKRVRDLPITLDKLLV